MSLSVFVCVRPPARPSFVSLLPIDYLHYNVVGVAHHHKRTRTKTKKKTNNLYDEKKCVWLCMLKSSVTRSILASFSRWLILSCWLSYLISILKNVWQVPLFRFSSKREPIRFSSFFFFLFSIWYTKYCIFFFFLRGNIIIIFLNSISLGEL